MKVLNNRYCIPIVYNFQYAAQIAPEALITFLIHILIKQYREWDKNSSKVVTKEMDWVNNDAAIYYESSDKTPVPIQNKKPWIQLELYREALVSSIVIQNCKDCEGYRFPDLIIRVGNEKVVKDSIDGIGYITNNHQCGLYIAGVGASQVIAGSIVTIACENFDETSDSPNDSTKTSKHPVTGKYVTIQAKPRNSADVRLIIGEVDVYGLSSIAGKRWFRCLVFIN